MIPLFWFDIILLSICAIVATALALTALGAGITVSLNRFFAAFTLVEAAWALLSLMLRLALWFNIGHPLLLSELSTLAFALLGPLLFLFTTCYIQQRSRQNDLAAILGIGLTAVLSIPLFQHQIVFNPQLELGGSISMELSTLGLAAAVVPFSYMFGSLVLFWRARDHLGEIYLALSVVILLVGFLLGGILNVGIPVLSLTNTFSVVLLGYGVISQQLFNPLKERTLELQQEIAERIRVEEALRKSEERFRIFSERARDAVYLHDDAGQIIDINIEACHTLGYTREELLNLAITDIDTSLDLEVLQKNWHLLKEGESSIVETRHRRKNGTTFPVEINTAKFPLGQQFAFLVSARNISSRQQTETQLRTLWRAIEQSHNTVVITDIRGRIEYSNPKFTQLTGYAPDEVLGRRSNILKSGRQSPEFYEVLWQTILAGDVWQGEFQNQKKNGELYWEFAAISPVRDAAGHLTHFVKVAEDITNRKKSEEALLRASRMETTATLAGGVAHKVNNLMTSVLGYAELLKSQFADNPEALDILTIIAKSARQTGDLAQQMLAFARGGKYQPRPLNLNHIIEEVLQLQQRDLPSRISIVPQLANNLWNIEADPTQMSQVILNLLANAVEAIEGTGQITIITQNVSINADNSAGSDLLNLTPGPYICCTLQDSGVGMDQETQARIFEPFFTTKFQGRGMGLAAVFGIIRNHGGQILLNSQLNQGTTVTIYLPALPAEFQPPFERLPGAEITPLSGTLQHQTILVVEDDPTITEILQKMLVLLGHQPLTASNGQEAVELAQNYKGHIALTLLDLSLPVITGAEAFPLLMAAHPTMKVIVYSGYELDDTAQSLLDAGASAFIQKPFQFDVLKTEIYKALNS